MTNRHYIKMVVYINFGTDVFNYIEVFYNVKRKQGFNNFFVSNFEIRYQEHLGSIKSIDCDSTGPFD